MTQHADKQLTVWFEPALSARRFLVQETSVHPKKSLSQSVDLVNLYRFFIFINAYNMYFRFDGQPGKAVAVSESPFPFAPINSRLVQLCVTNAVLFWKT